MLFISVYGLTVVTSFIAQAQLEVKLKNRFNDEKYMESEKSKGDKFKDIMQQLLVMIIPVYNVASPIVHLNSFDKYYEKIKENLLNNNYLVKEEVKTQQSQIIKKIDDTKEEIIIHKMDDKNINNNFINNYIPEEETARHVLKKTKKISR